MKKEKTHCFYPDFFQKVLAKHRHLWYYIWALHTAFDALSVPESAGKADEGAGGIN